METLVIRRKLVQRMREHASREAPREACGILAGEKGEKGKMVKRVYECRNVDAFPEMNYTVDPQQQLKIFQEVERDGLEIIGFYHSHPLGPMGPSTIDESRAAWHGHSHIIIVPRGEHGMTSWIWDEDSRKFKEERLLVIP